MRKFILLLSLISVNNSLLAAPFTVTPQQAKLFFDLPNRIIPDLNIQFKKFDSKLDFDSEKQTADINIVVMVDSLTTTAPSIVVNRVKSKKVFDVENYPTLSFKSKSSKYSGEILKEVSGDLTMRNMTVPVTFKTTNFKCKNSTINEKKVCAGSFKAIVDRNKFGITYPTYLGYHKDLTITFDIIEAREN